MGVVLKIYKFNLQKHFLHVDNQRYYGFLVDSEEFVNDGDRLHPEMYEIFKNRYVSFHYQVQLFQFLMLRV